MLAYTFLAHTRLTGLHRVLAGLALAAVLTALLTGARRAPTNAGRPALRQPAADQSADRQRRRALQRLPRRRGAAASPWITLGFWYCGARE